MYIYIVIPINITSNNICVFRRTDPLISTTIANDSTTTPSTPSGMDLNDTTVADDVGGVRTTEPIPISTNAQTTFEKPSTRFIIS